MMGAGSVLHFFQVCVGEKSAGLTTTPADSKLETKLPP